MLRVILMVVCITLAVGNVVWAEECQTIRDGTIYGEDGELVEIGFDEWGYNYQAHLFVGGYCDAYEDAEWCQPYVDVTLVMRWNDAWLSNKDCDGDGYLDRHYGYDSYLGSGALLTNFQKGSYIDEDGKKQRWRYYTKIVAAPLDAYIVDGVWYDADGIEIGPMIWDEFAVVQEVYRDTGNWPPNGVRYKRPFGVGFWRYTPRD